MKRVALVVMILLMTSCTTVKHNGPKHVVKQVDYPEIGKIATAHVGDHLVQKGKITEETARPALNNDVEYDLSLSNTIGYKGVLIEVIKADNNRITYKVIQHFP